MAKFLIKRAETPNGTISFRHEGKDTQYCEAGKVVEIDWMPTAGWGLQEAHYTDGSGNVVAIDLKTRKFTMPASHIEVGGTFKRFVVGDWTEGQRPNTGKLLAVGENGEPVPTNINADDVKPAAVSVTYAELMGMVNDGALTPGSLYRITDYVATTTQEGTRSANHPFDIIVRADSEDTLNENAFAAHHDGDEYFTSCKLEAWELKYCLDNDAGRFVWADENDGKGVVYYMKDEWGNEAPFDFKGIVFERSAEWFDDHQDWCNSVLGEVPQESMYLYWLSWVNEDNEVEDASIVGQSIPDDEGSYDGVYDNKIGSTIASTMGMSEGTESTAFSLPCTVIVNTYFYEDGIFYGCYSNTFGNGCYRNTFGNSCYSNTFGNDCSSNTFGNDCSSNTFGNSCSSNTFGNGCYSNTFGNGCYRNTFGNDCSSNTFGNGCYRNTFGNGCYGNTFGNDCSSNTFGNDCYSNTFGNDCSSNTFVENCQYIDGTTAGNGFLNVNILNSTAGTSHNRLNLATVNVVEGAGYVQCVGFNSNGDVVVWVPADNI